MVRLGVNVCLSHDATSLNPTSMFDQMRLAWHIATAGAGHAAGEDAAHPNAMPGDGHHQRRQGHGHRRQDRLAQCRASAPTSIMLRASDINMLPFHDGHSAVLHSANTEQRRHRDRRWPGAQIRRQDSQRQCRGRAPRGSRIVLSAPPARRRPMGAEALGKAGLSVFTSIGPPPWRGRPWRISRRPPSSSR